MDIIAKTYRNDVLDLITYGTYALVDAKGNVIDKFGDINELAYARSSAKLIQALVPVSYKIESGDEFSDEEIAQICASHSGEDFHIKLITEMLNKIGLDETYLKCGPHYPFKEEVVNRMKKNGELPKDIHNNCSGKHTGMLTACIIKDYNPKEYYKLDHPVQKDIIEMMSKICNIQKEDIKIGVDGCGVPVHAMRVYDFAHGMAKMSDPSDLDKITAKAISKVTNAMLKKPIYASGSDRNDYYIISKNPGKIVVKSGANGYFAGYLIKEKLGFALKLYDATPEVRNVIIIDLMRKLNMIRSEDEEFFEKTYSHNVLNHRKEIVGHIETLL